MQPLLPRELSLYRDSPAERPAVLSVVPGSRGTEFGVQWESPRREFFTSLRDLFTGPRPLKESDPTSASTFHVDWIQGRVPAKEFLAACVWHAAIIWILILPIWGFLPPITPTLAPVQIEMTLYDPPDLPAIRLPAATPKAATHPKKETDYDKPAVEKGADAYHPRQTIISIPVRVTHPRQTLIQPDAPPAPPKIVPPLPNIIQWAASEPVKPKPQYAPTASAPRVQQRSVRDAEAPDAAKLEKNSGPLNIAAATSTVPRPRIVLNPMSAPAAAQRTAPTQSVAAPEIGAAGDDASLHRLIALSATPAPPAPGLSVPQGNLAARISISPEGGKPGTPGGSEHAGSSGAGVANSSGVGGTNNPGNSGSSGGNSPAGASTAGASSLPASVSVSAGNVRTGATSGGGIAPAGLQSGRLNLKPKESSEPAKGAPRGPVNVAGFDPRLPPEKILSGREIYTLHVNLPNLTSASGSWILNFSQLEEGLPPYRHDGELSGLAPLEKADPEYPPEIIKQHIHGEVVLYAIIRKDGSVDSVQIVTSLDPQLDRNAANALTKWKFHPAMRAGVPVDLEAVIHVPFVYIDPRN